MYTVTDRLAQVGMVRKLVYAMVGIVTYPGLTMFNRLKISGTEHLKGLPRHNVLFVSNHQTYFADVITFLHIFCAVKWHKCNRLGLPYYLLNPFSKVHFVAAEETMKDNLLTRLFALAGALMVKRTWRAEGQDMQRNLDPSDTHKISRALSRSWVITFPQGTTKPFAPGRRGTAHLIREHRPIVIPVVINGFWRAFTKKGLSFKKKGTLLTVRFKEPLQINYSAPVDEILAAVMDAIEQSQTFMQKSRHHLLARMEK
ncbi:MAG: 1-acyl-sn-glycerol-3-phosphate acyltransferase [Bacteroidetes bacterium]|nr:1-acyl-sn-glycerol-3-phosphate acyltransferase [Bacteroidota bacterium]